jgi:AraC-like DNA-binding protein
VAAPGGCPVPAAAAPAATRLRRLHRGDHPAAPGRARHRLGPLVVKLADSAHRPPQFLLGAHGTAHVVEGDCAPSYLEVWLAPLGAYTLLGHPMDQLSGHTVDLAQVLGPTSRRLADQLRDAPTWRQRVALLDRFLVGLAPKTAARLVRFNAVWRHLDRRRPLDWADLARQTGYADQAHLVRDFRQFTGTTPTAFLAQVNSVQAAVAAGC